MTTQPHAVALLRRGRRWDEAKPMIEQEGVREHLAYLGGLFERGIVELAGPFQQAGDVARDPLVGLVVYRVDRETAARHAEDDPAVRAGLLSFEVHAWYP